MDKKYINYNIVAGYADSVISGEKRANVETIQMCKRFKRDLTNTKYDFKPKDAEFVIQIIDLLVV